MCACIERQAQPEKACNNRPGGNFGQRNRIIEVLPKIDQHCPSRPSRRRLGASVLLEDSQVMSAPRRPGCASGMNENQMRSLPLGFQGNVARPKRCAKCGGL